MKLKPPTFLLEHMKKLVSKGANCNSLHITLWNDLFPTDDRERAAAAQLINWFYRKEKLLGTDIFVPPVPSLNGKNCEELFEKAIFINKMASDIITDDVAAYFSVSADVFENRAVVEGIANYLSEGNAKVGLIKFTDPQNFVGLSFSEHAQNNLSLFLKILKLRNQTKETPMITGAFGGSGLGYCMLGAGFDFFTDTVNNYAQYPMPSKGQKKARYRKCLNDKTLVPEKYEGIKSMFVDSGQNPMPYLPPEAGSYTREQFINNKIDPETWSRDCKLNGIGIWNEFTGELTDAIRTKTDTLFFDKIQRSRYAVLTPIIKDVRDF
jgi:hypothetical protein